MKLIRVRNGKKVVPGVLADKDTAIDCSGFGGDWNESFFGGDGILRLAGWLTAESEKAPRLMVEGGRLAPPVANPSKIVCIGLNFLDHAEESKLQPPAETVVFLKATTALAGPNDDVVIPRGSVKTDWEVELAVVIGRRASYVEEADALAHVAGYCLHNDYSEREFQLERCGQWDKGKGCDTFAPLGPFVATQDEIEDVNNLSMWLKVNGATKQNGTTANLIFKVPFLVSYVSRFMTLLPGDVISTGTPAGVGLGMKPPQFLQPGDAVELGIDGLGEQRQVARAWSP